MSDRSHLDALELRLSDERIYLVYARDDNERLLRSIWIKQIEREIADELILLRVKPEPDLSTDELYAQLTK